MYPLAPLPLRSHEQGPANVHEWWGFGGHSRPLRVCAPGTVRGTRSRKGGWYATGVVKWFDARKRYGFISQDGRPDVFLHANEVVGASSLREGQRVDFHITERSGGGPRPRSEAPGVAGCTSYWSLPCRTPRAMSGSKLPVAIASQGAGTGDRGLCRQSW